MKNIPVYRYPWAYAQEFGEIDQYRESRKANKACRDAIEKAIAANSEYVSGNHGCAGVHFDASTAAKQVVMEFGMVRTLYILANHIQLKFWDGRFCNRNKDFYYTIPIVKENDALGDTALTISDAKAHSVIVDAFATKVRELYQLSLLKK